MLDKIKKVFEKKETKAKKTKAVKKIVTKLGVPEEILNKEVIDTIEKIPEVIKGSVSINPALTGREANRAIRGKVKEKRHARGRFNK